MKKYYNFKRKGNIIFVGKRESRGYKPISKEISLIWSSEQGRRANALALGADERRDKLR